MPDYVTQGDILGNDEFHELLDMNMETGGVESRRVIASLGYLHDDLKDDPDESVRECVANESTDVPILHYLSADPSERVRVAAMLNPAHGQGTLF